MDRQNRAARRSFLRGALVLSAGVLLVKLIGALFKIPLSAVIREDGMGYFGTAYSFYNVIFSLATAGFPVAVSRAVSAAEAEGRPRRAETVRAAAQRVFLCTGLIGTALMLALAPAYTRAVGNPGALPAMLALAPCILFCSLMASYRGYAEGLSDMRPTAVSQIIEAAVKLLLGLSAAYFVMRYFTRELEARGTVLGVRMEPDAGARAVSALGAAAAVLGVTLGALCGLLYLRRNDRVAFNARRKNMRESDTKALRAARRKIARQLLRDAAPVAVGAVAMSVSGLIDASFLQTRTAAILRDDPAPLLAVYGGQLPAELSAVPNFLFGCYSMALTLFLLVPSLTQAIGTSALPGVTRAWVRGAKDALGDAVETVLRVTGLFALPAGIGLSALAGPVTVLLYGDRPSTPIVARALGIMGIAAVFAAVATPLGSMLQAAGRMELPVILTLSGLLLKVCLNYFLAGVPEINILAGGVSSLVCYAVVAALELFALRRVTGTRVRFGLCFGKPLLAALGCGALARAVCPLWERIPGFGRFAALPAALCGAAVYALLLFLLGAADASLLPQLPGEKKFAKKFGKYLKNAGR